MADQAIQEGVKNALKNIWGVLDPRPCFLATHFSCGTPGLPGYVIKSAARAQTCRFAEWAGGDELLHEKVIIRHARQFRRSVTVPALLAKLYDAHKKPVLITITVSARAAQKALLVTKHEEDGYVCFEVRFNQRFASALCPDKLPETYFAKLYEAARTKLRSDPLTEDELRPFDLPRYEAFGMLIERLDSLKHDVAKLLPPGAGDLNVRAWDLLGTLQSALLYFEGGRYENDPNRASGFACAFPLSNDRGEFPATPFGFLLGSPAIKITKKSDRVHNILNSHLWSEEVRSHVRGDDQKEYSDALCMAVKEATAMDWGDILSIRGWLVSEIANVVRFSGQRKRLVLTGLWLVYLLSQLRGTKHEAKAVDFWFVAGEQTEFDDDVHVRLDKHPLRRRLSPERGPEADTELLPQFERVGETWQLEKKRCDLIVRRLAKEHYPWFSRGRHAMFFDISSEELKPSGLAELRSGPWNRLLIESFTLPDEQELRIPGCLIAFIDAASGEAGLLVCQPERRNDQPPQKARVKRILMLRDGKWQPPSDKRQKTLENHFRKNVSWLLEGEDATTISEVATMIADDPHSGGTLVFLEDKEQAKHFIQLGAPWEFEGRFQDRIPLISHDGATVLWKEDALGMAYRQLLTAASVEDVHEIISKLRTQSLGNNAEFPLMGAGTRRWSAALCALRSGVKMVVVISTDGDLTCWWSKNDAPRDIFYHHIPVDFDPERHKETQIP